MSLPAHRLLTFHAGLAFHTQHPNTTPQYNTPMTTPQYNTPTATPQQIHPNDNTPIQHPNDNTPIQHPNGNTPMTIPNLPCIPTPGPEEPQEVGKRGGREGLGARPPAPAAMTGADQSTETGPSGLPALRSPLKAPGRPTLLL
uniref:Uncharacterized protein n=1 Tax=Pipistrellus kuhlii TaxID=59472 RepID=A0A7J7QTV3_PIPKU|nr:hypothetical protein mPipKuh1_008463 [Pipistrellus kuhlii]